MSSSSNATTQTSTRTRYTTVTRSTTTTEFIAKERQDNEPSSLKHIVDPPAVESEILIIHGLVPGVPRLHGPSSLSLSTKTRAIISSDAQETQSTSSSQHHSIHATLSRASTYPRPSPPTFLYPSPIVPRQVAHDLSIPQHSTASAMHLGYGIEVLIWVAMVIGLVWWVLVVLINFPPRTWTCLSRPLWARSSAAKTSDKEENEGRKESKEELVEPHGEDYTMGCSSATRPRHYFTGNGGSENGSELTYRRPNTITTPSKLATRSTIHLNPAQEIASSPSQPSTPAYPINPFLLPPTPPRNFSLPTMHSRNLANSTPPFSRTSTEWAHQRAQFFSTTSPSPTVSLTPINPPSPSPFCLSTTPPHPNASQQEFPLHRSGTDEIAGMEAGQAPLVTNTKREGFTKEKRTSSWVDTGLSMVESAVDRVVVGLVRWTDDDGEQDRMLLPVAREIYA